MGRTWVAWHLVGSSFWFCLLFHGSLEITSLLRALRDRDRESERARADASCEERNTGVSEERMWERERERGCSLGACLFTEFASELHDPWGFLLISIPHAINSYTQCFVLLVAPLMFRLPYTVNTVRWADFMALFHFVNSVCVCARICEFVCVYMCMPLVTQVPDSFPKHLQSSVCTH